MSSIRRASGCMRRGWHGMAFGEGAPDRLLHAVRYAVHPNRTNTAAAATRTAPQSRMNKAATGKPEDTSSFCPAVAARCSAALPRRIARPRASSRRDDAGCPAHHGRGETSRERVARHGHPTRSVEAHDGATLASIRQLNARRTSAVAARLGATRRRSRPVVSCGTSTPTLWVASASMERLRRTFRFADRQPLDLPAQPSWAAGQRHEDASPGIVAVRRDGRTPRGRSERAEACGTNGHGPVPRRVRPRQRRRGRGPPGQEVPGIARAGRAEYPARPGG